jgi:hypothetical protein
MRKTLVAAAVATVFSAGAFLASGANAMTLAAPSGLRAATEGITTAEPVRYVCYHTRSGRRVCEWRRAVVRPYYGGYYGGYAPYYGGYYGGYAPYYGYGYGPGYGFGLGYGWGGGWGGNRVVVNRTIVRRDGGGHRHR